VGCIRRVRKGRTLGEEKRKTKARTSAVTVRHATPREKEAHTHRHKIQSTNDHKKKGEVLKRNSAETKHRKRRWERHRSTSERTTKTKEKHSRQRMVGTIQRAEVPAEAPSVAASSSLLILLCDAHHAQYKKYKHKLSNREERQGHNMRSATPSSSHSHTPGVHSVEGGVFNPTVHEASAGCRPSARGAALLLAAHTP
jgi:hypothetical protein